MSNPKSSIPMFLQVRTNTETVSAAAQGLRIDDEGLHFIDVVGEITSIPAQKLLEVAIMDVEGKNESYRVDYSSVRHISLQPDTITIKVRNCLLKWVLKKLFGR